jgi:hypothetical protein
MVEGAIVIVNGFRFTFEVNLNPVTPRLADGMSKAQSFRPLRGRVTFFFWPKRK